MRWGGGEGSHMLKWTGWRSWCLGDCHDASTHNQRIGSCAGQLILVLVVGAIEFGGGWLVLLICTGGWQGRVVLASCTADEHELLLRLLCLGGRNQQFAREISTLHWPFGLDGYYGYSIRPMEICQIARSIKSWSSYPTAKKLSCFNVLFRTCKRLCSRSWLKGCRTEGVGGGFIIALYSCCTAGLTRRSVHRRSTVDVRLCCTLRDLVGCKLGRYSRAVAWGITLGRHTGALHWCCTVSFSLLEKTSIFVSQSPLATHARHVLSKLVPISWAPQLYVIQWATCSCYIIILLVLVHCNVTLCSSVVLLRYVTYVTLCLRSFCLIRRELILKGRYQ